MDSLDRPMQELLRQGRTNVVGAPGSAAAWGRYGEALHTLDYLESARLCYSNAVTLAQDAPQWRHLLGLLQLADEPVAAAENLRRAAELCGPTNDAPRLRLAQALVERGQFTDAGVQVDLLLRQRPDHPAARIELARIQLARNEAATAARTLEPALTNAFTSRVAHGLLAQARQRQGDTTGAAEAARRATALPRSFDWPDPFLREVQSLRVDRANLQDAVNGFIAQQRLAEAETAAQRLAALFPEDPETWLLLGRLRYRQRQCDEAEKMYRHHLQLSPDSVNGLTQFALSLLCQQRWAEARAPLEKALRLKPDFAQAHYNLGHARARSGDALGAIQSFETALRCAPGDVPSHVALAEELARGGQKERAIEHLQTALALDPKSPTARRLAERLGVKVPGS